MAIATSTINWELIAFIAAAFLPSPGGNPGIRTNNGGDK